MTRKECVQRINLKTDFDKSEIAKMLELAIEEMRTALINGEEIYFRSLGTIKAVDRKGKLVRNISKNKSFMMPAYKKVVIKPSKGLQDEINH